MIKHHGVPKPLTHHDAGVIGEVEGRDNIQAIRGVSEPPSEILLQTLTGADQRVKRQILHRHRFPDRERRVTPHDKAPAVLTRKVEVVVLREISVIHNDREVEEPFIKLCRDVIGVPAHKVRADSGIPLMKPLHRAGEILDRVGLRRPDRDAAGIEVIQGPELLLSLIDERQDILGPLSEKHAGVGEPDTVIRSLVQLPPELFLEVLQLFGKRRLGHKQPLSRPRHIAFAGYCHEVAKHPDFHCGLLWTVMPFVSRHPFEKIINLSGSCHRPRL